MRPGHGPQVQIAKDICIEVVRVGIEMTSSSWDVSPEQIHVVFVHTAAMIGDSTWDVGCVASSLNLSPSVVALKGASTWRRKLIWLNFTEALEVKLVKRVKASLTNVKSTKDKQFFVKNEA